MAASNSSSSQGRSSYGTPSHGTSSHNRATHGSSSSSRHIPWQHAYEEVLAENDIERLFKLVEVAEAAVLTRRAELERSGDHHSERKAIEKAVAKLQTVKRKQLKFL
jgi:hypothetical protein